jgi:hypothetical protein
MTYHAAEIGTTAGYYVILEVDAAVFDKVSTYLGSLEEIETYAVGTVQASTEAEAAQKVLNNAWEYSQLA